MPDLTTEYATACATVREWTGTVTGSNGATYTLTWERDYSPNRTTEYHYTCTCSGFKYRGTCKHVRAAYDDDTGKVSARCGWDNRWHSTPHADANGCCPLCGSATFTYTYGA